MNLHLVLAGEASGERGRCVPLTPASFSALKSRFPIIGSVESNPRRVFLDDAYHRLGIGPAPSLRGSEWVLAASPPRPETLRPGSWYFVSSLGLRQGLAEQGPMLMRMKELGCTLVDVERLQDAGGHHRASWGRFAGMLGMAEALAVLGQKLALSGADTPLAGLKKPSEYPSSQSLLAHLDDVGEAVSEEGLPEQAYPLMTALIGTTRFEEGIDAVLERFPLKTFSVHVVDENTESFSGDQYSLYKVVFHEADLFEIPGEGFDPMRFRRDPGVFRSRFDRYLPSFQLVVNGAAWGPGAPAVLTRDYLRQAAYLHSNPLPKVALDLSGSARGPLGLMDEVDLDRLRIQTYVGRTDTWLDGVAASGTTVLGCEAHREVFPAEASEDFSTRFAAVLEELMGLGAGQDASDSWVPDWLRDAMVLDRGRVPPGP